LKTGILPRQQPINCITSRFSACPMVLDLTRTEFNFVNDVPHFDTYIISERKFAAIAAAAGATIIMNNQSQFDSAALKARMLADRHPGERHPLDVGAEAVARYFKIEDECAQAVRLKLLNARHDATQQPGRQE